MLNYNNNYLQYEMYINDKLSKTLNHSFSQKDIIILPFYGILFLTIYLTPLHAAVQNSNYDIVKYLCTFPGINKDARSNKGYDATHYALNKGDYEMVDILNPEYLLGYNGAYNYEDYDDYEYDMDFGDYDDDYEDDDDDEYFY